MYEEAARILAMQKEGQRPVDEAARTLARTERLSPTQRESLKNAEMIQRQVSNRVTNPDDGLDEQIQQFLRDLDDFKLTMPDVRAQMERMKQGVGRIRDRHLAPAEQGLTRSLKGLDDQAGSQPQNPQSQAKAAPPSPGAQAKSDRGAQAESKASEAQPAEGKEGREAKGSENAQAKGSENAQAKGSESAQGKGSESAQARGSESAQGKVSESAQAKGSESAQAKGSEGAQAKGSESAQAKGSESSKGAESAAASKGAQASDSGQQQQSPPQSPPAGNDQRSDRQSPRLALADAQRNQRAIADELQKMLDDLSEFETFREAVKDAQKLLKDQEDAMKQSADAASKPELMGKPIDALNEAQKSQLENLAARQTELAKSLQNLEGKMDEMAKRTDNDDPLSAAALREAAQQSRQKGTAAKMGQSGEQLGKNQMGSARAGQEQARNDLKDLVDALQNTHDRSLARLVKELKNAEAQLEKLRERQAKNLIKTERARQNKDPQARKAELQRLAKEQEEIQKELERQLQRLSKLRADAAAQAGSKASGKMSRAQQNLEQGEGEQARKDQEETLEDLDDAQQQLEQARRDAEEQLAMEQLAKMGDTLKSLGERQDKVVEETANFEKARLERKGQLTLAQRNEVRNLGKVQEGLKEETKELIEKLEGAPVFALTLKRAAENMDAAAQRLSKRQTDEETQRAEKSAGKRFKQLIDALKPDPAKGGGQQRGGGDGAGGGGGGGADDSIPTTAQLKMLKQLQQEINERTELFDDLRRRPNGLTEAQEAELKTLEEEQRAVGDLARDLTRPRRDDGEDLP
jgi:hypothetical protein